MNETDIVVPWVDGSDPEWQELRRKFMPGDQPFAEKAYRDWGFMRYWFRGVERNLPWIRKVHFITWGHLPKWLDTNHPKLHIVRHEDYIPGRYLPTFSSAPIEWNIHRIEGLAERFIYANDDTLFIGRVPEEYYFRDGLPCDFLEVQPITEICAGGFGHILWNGIACINRNFDPRECFDAHRDKWFHKDYPDHVIGENRHALQYHSFPGFVHSHLPEAYLKSDLKELWNREYHLLDKTCLHKFRCNEDVIIWLARDWRLACGRFTPRMPLGGVSIGVGERPEKIRDTILSGRNKIICLNEDQEDVDFERRAAWIRELLEMALPEMSSFEKF